MRWWGGLRQAEKFFAVGRDLRETPRGIKDDFDVGFADAGQFKELALNLGGDLSGEGTALRGQRHLHVDARIAGFRNGFEANVVNEAEVNDVAGEFGIVTFLELGENLLLGEAHDAFASWP